MPRQGKMKISPLTSWKLKTLAFYGLVGALAGIVIVSGIRGPGLESLASGMVTGLVISVSILSLDFFFLTRFIRSVPLAVAILIKAVAFLLVFATFITISVKLFSPEGQHATLVEIWRHPRFAKSMAGSFFISFMISLSMSINVLLGKRVLLNMLAGRYHKPREVERIFMFLDIKSSTAITERIGHVRYLSLLNDFLFDLTKPLLVTKGEINKYMGDGVILTWDMKKGVEKANCVRFFQLLKREIRKEADNYKAKYGLVPEFKAGVHCGVAVTGKMGLYRMEIAYIGDVLNTTARLESKCNALEQEFIISVELLDKLRLPEDIRAVMLGPVELRGKAEPVELAGVRFKD